MSLEAWIQNVLYSTIGGKDARSPRVGLMQRFEFTVFEYSGSANSCAALVFPRLSAPCDSPLSLAASGGGCTSKSPAISSETVQMTNGTAGDVRVQTEETAAAAATDT